MNCPSCTSGREGYLILSPDPFIPETLGLSSTDNAMNPQGQSAFLLDAYSAWVEKHHFYGMLEYWERYHKPRSWTFHLMSELSRMPDKLPKPVPWDWIRDHTPKVWIDEMIQQGRIRMHFQPIVELKDTPVLIGYELLARGLDPSGKLIFPGTLLDEARDQNRLFHLDRACRIEAIRQADRQGSPKALYFINFIPSVIYVAEHCLETTFNALQNCRVSPSQIIFEVTESEFVRDLDHLKSILLYYRAHGLRYALDDVGEGYNTLDTLRFLEPDIVKLDRKWVSNIDTDPKKQDVALETLETTKKVGATALAEGVESPEEARILKEMGYLWQQGYLYGKPSETPQAL